MGARANQDSLDLGWSDEPLSGAIASSTHSGTNEVAGTDLDATAPSDETKATAASAGANGAPLDSWDDEPTRVASTSVLSRAPVVNDEVPTENAAPPEETEPSTDVDSAVSESTAEATDAVVEATGAEAIVPAPADATEPANAEEGATTADDSAVEPAAAELATEATAAPAQAEPSAAAETPAPLGTPAAAAATLTTEGNAVPAESRTAPTPRTIPPIKNPPPAELARAPWAVDSPTATAPAPVAEPAAVPPQEAAPSPAPIAVASPAPIAVASPAPIAVASPAVVASTVPVSSSPVPSASASPMSASPTSTPTPSVAPPPIVPVPWPSSSLAPTANEWSEFGSPSFLETMKRTRPTSAWTGVALFVAAATFVAGIAVGRGTSSPSLPPVPVPAPLPPSVAAPSPVATTSPTSASVTPETMAAAPAAAPIAVTLPPTKTLAPFDSKAARTAVDAAAAKTTSCRQTTEPKGALAATVTFAPTGRVSQVTINTKRYAGTKTGQCITSRLSQAQIDEFSGNPGTIKKTVTVR